MKETVSNILTAKTEDPIKISISNLNIYFKDFHALKNINLEFEENKIIALIGPSGCGKSTCLKTINRMNELSPFCRIEGKVLIDGINIYSSKINVNQIRKKAGMVAQMPNPFPMNIYDNVAYGPKVHGIKNKKTLNEIVEKSLKEAALCEELKDKLKQSAFSLSGGQQQRLCIARALAVQPEILLMDEPTSALDPISTLKIEDLMLELKKKYTVLVVTHDMRQTTRISDNTAFFSKGEVVEYDKTQNLFRNPKNKLTEKYITGRFD